ncbi:EamA family transporter [Serinibacter arcticus]|uniref:EamA family transporter n=2 Tax=Serinibacter arcticus TaxID=1655435 RepID=A0A2U1ZZ63_9MICO|nr:EamA family transporter [Serinibacter arcticus]
MKIAIEGLSPVQVTAGRLTFGAIMLVALMAIGRRRWPTDPRLLGKIAVLSVLLCVAPFLLFGWAAQHLPSGISSIFNATTPIMTLLVGVVALPTERLTRDRVAGFVLALLGVLVVAGPWRIELDGEGSRFLLAQLACLGATLCYGLGAVYSRRLLRGSTIDSTTLAATQISLAAVLALVLVGAVGRTPMTITAPVLLSIIAVGAIGTGVAYVWFNDIIRLWGAPLAASVTYLTPVVGVVLGVLVLKEEVHWNEGVGALVVIAGILLTQGVLTRRRAVPAQ